ncbi:MAG: hypothetical protein CM1200mP7_3060 [Chloroflexota bacterium]|nr:MAG: hypothetical protein CM1200mP7_3060 [Chloroflexota bacterium]
MPDATTEILETLLAFNVEIQKGTTKAIGCANHNKEQLLKSIEISEKNKIPGVLGNTNSIQFSSISIKRTIPNL